jgi:hypothetical protein
MRFGLIVVAQLALIALGMEVLCRLFIGHTPELEEDPRFGKITKAHSAVVQSFEGHSASRTNMLGNLDDEMPGQLPPDSVMVLGDSFTEARHVPRADRFTDILAARTLRRVWNVGHAGWSPVNALGYLAANREKFAPKTLILQVSSNDLADLVASKRGHVVERAGRLEMVIPTRGGSSSVRATISKSAFAGQLLGGIAGLFGDKGGDEDGGSDCTTPPTLAVHALPWLFGKLAQLHPDARVLYIPKLEYHGGCYDRCEVSRDVFAAGAAKAGLRFIDPTQAMCEDFVATGQPLHGFWNSIPGTGHLNGRGHAQVAAVIAADLAR